MTRGWNHSGGRPEPNRPHPHSKTTRRDSEQDVAEKTPPAGVHPETTPTQDDETPAYTSDRSNPTTRDWGPGWANGHFEPGQILFGKYQIVRKLGQGGMGAVWLVRHTQLEIERAIKLIVAGIAFDPQMRARFRREAQAMAKFTHPNAVTVHDADARPNSPVAFIEMEYVEGESLKALLEPGVPMPLDWTGRILDQLCDVLQVAHDHGIVHRDLKPANLMLVSDRPPGQELLKVLDFGIAKILESEGSQTDEPLTQVGFLMGTPQYMSPEQVEGDPTAIDARSDIYTVGLILYELLTGFRPFEGHPHRLCADHLHTPPPRFAQRNPRVQLPPEVEALVLRCLEKDPNKRPQRVREVAEEFDRLTRPKEPPPVPETPPRTPVWTWLVPVVALVCGFAGLALSPWFRPAPPGKPPTVLKIVPSSLTIRAGDRSGKTVVVVVPESGTITPPEPPPGVTIQIDPESSTAGVKQFHITAELIAKPGSLSLPFRATTRGKTLTTKVSLQIEAPEVFLPEPRANFVPVGDGTASLVSFEGRNYPRRIARRVDDIQVDFLLIDGTRGAADAHPFYIMENKVWNALFEKWTGNSANRSLPRGQERFPATNISAQDAYEFAKWLGGPSANLPSRFEWDRAAGFYNNDGTPKQGPILRDWDENDPTQIAIRLKNPLPVGTATRDQSPFGCRDIAGNGMEWTRDWADNRTHLPVIPEHEGDRLLSLRGRSHDDLKPLLYFHELDEVGCMPPESHPAIGFRVVIELEKP